MLSGICVDVFPQSLSYLSFVLSFQPAHHNVQDRKHFSRYTVATTSVFSEEAGKVKMAIKVASNHDSVKGRELR